MWKTSCLWVINVYIQKRKEAENVAKQDKRLQRRIDHKVYSVGLETLFRLKNWQSRMEQFYNDDSLWQAVQGRRKEGSSSSILSINKKV